MVVATAFLLYFLVLLANTEAVMRDYAETQDQFGSCSDFGYEPFNGPEKWAKFCPACGGRWQSPINIVTKDSKYQPTPEFGGTFWNGSGLGVRFVLRNINYTVQLESLPYAPSSTLKGGPFTTRYNFDHVQFTWGADRYRGSSHTIDGRTFPLEGQVTFINEKYHDFKDAIQTLGGVVKLSFLHEISDKDNRAYAPLINALNDVKSPGSVSISDEKIFIGDILSALDRNNYYLYAGSLTTPPCTESVFWVVFASPLKISNTQVAAFRKLESPYGLLVDNFRPIQQLNYRLVKASKQLPSSSH